MDNEDDLPEFARIINSMNEELLNERDKYENEIKLLKERLLNSMNNSKHDINILQKENEELKELEERLSYQYDLANQIHNREIACLKEENKDLKEENKELIEENKELEKYHPL